MRQSCGAAKRVAPMAPGSCALTWPNAPSRGSFATTEDAPAAAPNAAGSGSPVGPQSLLGGVGEAGAAHDEANGTFRFAAAGGVLGFGDLGVAAVGVVDVGPCGAADCLDRCANSGYEGHGDRPFDVVGVETVDQFA